jgi:hypothetical protein
MTKITDAREYWLRLASKDAVTSVQDLPGGRKLYHLSLTLYVDEE